MNKNLIVALLLALMAIQCAGPNAKPQAPTDVNWPAAVQPNEEAVLAVVLLDADGDSVACRFDWGNGDTSEWSGYVASGQTLTTTHAWTQLGLCDVRMQARDRRGAVSDWSPQHEVTVGDVHPLLWSVATRQEYSIVTSPVVVVTPAGEMVFWGESHLLRSVDTRGVARAVGISVDSTYDGYFIGQPAWCPISGHLLVGSDEGELYCFASDMDIVWHWPGNWNSEMFDDCAWGTASVDGDVVYVMRTEDYEVLYALRDLGDRGLAIASLVPGDPEGDEVLCPPVVDREGNVYVATSMGFVSRYSAGLEHLVWSGMVTEYELYGAVVGKDGNLFAVSADAIFAVSPTGSVQWSRSMSEPTVPVVGDSLLYIGDADGVVWALRPEGNGDVWRTEVGPSFTSSPLLAANGRLYLYDGDNGSLYCLSSDSGHVLWRTDVRVHSGSSRGRDMEDLKPSMTVTSAGDIVVADETGVYCVRGYPDGQLANTPWPKWQHDTYNTGCARTPIP
jgi:outer membrane protein assembly factor BamB